MGDWLKSARDEIGSESEATGEKPLIQAAVQLSDMVLGKLRDINAQLLGNRGVLRNFDKRSIHPADLSFRMLVMSEAGTEPIIWSLVWPGVGSGRSQIAVTLIPGSRGRPDGLWSFLVNIEPVDVEGSYYGNKDHQAPSFFGAADEASLERLLSDACKRGSELFRD